VRAFVVIAFLISSAASAQTAPEAGHDVLVKVGSRPTVKGAAANFTGDVLVTPLFDPPAPGRGTTGQVTFAPGARTNWHTHPGGQTLIVTAGCGWTQVEGGPVRRICAGDTVWVPPGVRHWHGATETSSFTHIAVSEKVDGKNVTWLEPVTDAQYKAGESAR
jgi:quercetin dioxygenase-like cupin family protein